MRFSYLATGLFASAVIARNVINLDELHAVLDSEKEISKRDARNVVNLADLRAALDKQENEAKNANKNSKRSQNIASMPLLQNLLPQISSVSIFAGYLRDDQELLLDVEKENSFTILVAPSNSAIADKLDGAKPWEFPKKIMNDETDDTVVAYNLHHFLKAHILTDVESISDNNELTSKLLDGRTLLISHDPTTGSYLLKVDGVAYSVTSVSLADNGIVFVIEDVLSKPTQH